MGKLDNNKFLTRWDYIKKSLSDTFFLSLGYYLLIAVFFDDFNADSFISFVIVALAINTIWDQFEYSSNKIDDLQKQIDDLRDNYKL